MSIDGLFSMGADPPEHVTVPDAVVFLRDFAEFLYENSPKSERTTTSVLTMALAKAASLMEESHMVTRVLATEMQHTLSAGKHDEDNYLRALAVWKAYEEGI